MKDTHKIAYLYIFICPLCSEVKYIGCSTKPKTRLLSLKNGQCKNKRMLEWYNKLKAENKEPILIILKEVAMKDRIAEEKQLIKNFSKYNKNTLFNISHNIWIERITLETLKNKA